MCAWPDRGMFFCLFWTPLLLRLPRPSPATPPTYQTSAKPCSNLKPLRLTIQWANNQTHSVYRIAFVHFMCTRELLRRIKCQCRKITYPQPKFLKVVRSTNPPSNQQTTIRFSLCVLALYGHLSSPKKNESSRSIPNSIKSCFLWPPPPRHCSYPSTSRATNNTQLGFRMDFLHLMTIRVHLRESKRRGRKSSYSQSKFLKTLRSTTKWATNKTQTGFHMSFLHLSRSETLEPQLNFLPSLPNDGVIRKHIFPKNWKRVQRGQHLKLFNVIFNGNTRDAPSPWLST